MYGMFVAIKALWHKCALILLLDQRKELNWCSSRAKASAKQVLVHASGLIIPMSLSWVCKMNVA